MHEECDKGHGRVEIRRIQAADIRATGASFPGAKQVFRIERETWRGPDRAKSTEVAYGITSLGRCVASPVQLLALTRGHWTIENRSHLIRDVAFSEDACRIRRGSGPQIFAALRNLAMGVIRLAGGRSIAAAIRAYGWNPQRALRAVGVATE